MKHMSQLGSQRSFDPGEHARSAAPLCTHPMPSRRGGGKSIATPLRVEFLVTCRKETNIVFFNRHKSEALANAGIPTISSGVFAVQAGEHTRGSVATHCKINRKPESVDSPVSYRKQKPATQIDRKLFSSPQSQKTDLSSQSLLAASYCLTPSQTGATPR